MNKIRMTLAALALAVPLHMAMAEQIITNGNWWRTQNRSQQVDFMIGFFDGMDLGGHFSYWKYQLDGAKNGDTIASQASTSYDAMMAKYMKSVTAGQLVDGLDVFYGDYRNRSIRIHDAVWLVLRQIAGETDLNLDNWRKNANY